MNPLVVYTAITGGFNDILAPVKVPPDAKGRPVRFVCFTDANLTGATGWEQRPPRFRASDPRRTARGHKILSHLVFPEAEFTLWHDGSHHLRVNPWDVIDSGLTEDRIFATFKHPQRHGVFQEIQACLILKKDVPAHLYTQAERYRQEGYPDRLGLFETACIARRRSATIAKLNEVWWDEIQRGSCRDQISLPYAIWKSGIRQIGVLPGSRDKSKYFAFRAHR